MRTTKDLITQLEARREKLKIDYRDAEEKADEADRQLLQISSELSAVVAKLVQLRAKDE